MTESNRGTPQRLYRFSLYVKKRDDMTDEEFGKHWSTSHPPLVQEWMVKYGIVKYVQYHTPSFIKDETVETWEELKDLEMQQWDGVVEITVRRIKDFVNARKDKYYLGTVIPDE
ncbi:uncharacterized protein AB675_9895, partial [Cyphellophora attinorum]